MNEPLQLITTYLTAFIAGAVLGGFFFGGLWWTVRKSVSSKQPALWVLGSLLLRMSVTMAGFYYVSGGQWERLLACFAGLIAARLLVTWLTKIPETIHAP